MLKTISGRFGYVVGEDPIDTDDGARQPDTPNSHTKRDKKEKRSRGGTSTTEMKGSSASPAPTIFNKPQRQELKQGHDPNKVHGVAISTRHIIIEPSQRHFNYQPSTRGIIAEPSTKILGVGVGVVPSTRNLNISNSNNNNNNEPQKSMRILDKKNSLRHMDSPDHKNKTSMNGVDKKQPSTRTMNAMNGGSDKKATSPRNMISIDEKSSFGKMNSIAEKKVIGNMNSIAEKKAIGNMNSIDEKKTIGNMSSIVEKKTIGNMSSIVERSTFRGMGSIDEKSPRNMSSIDEKSPRNMSSIDEKSPRNISSIDENSSPRNTNQILNVSSNSKSSTSSKNSTSTKSTATNSTSTTKTISSIDNSKSNSNHSRDTINKSNHSEMTRNVDNRSGKNRERKDHQRGRPGKRSGNSFGTPAHFDRDRPSTALITRKELEEILAAKVKEEMLEKKTMPPKSGTNSTDIWVANADKEPISEEFSVASGASVEDESPFGNRENSEYDINFHDISEEEMTEHTVHTDDSDQDGGDSFDAGELTLADSMERRCTTIRFDEYDELQTCLHINDYTQGEIKRSWYRREDYDKMVDLARKTASKAVKREKELRDELDTMLQVSSQSPTRAGRRNGDFRDNPAKDDENGNHSGDNRSVGSGKTADGKRKKPIEYRGLEAWTPEGSQKCRSLKENAIELVWNEQSRQWEDGSFDPDAISEMYRPVAKIALAAARERAMIDEKMVKKLSDQEDARAEKKRSRNILHKSKLVIKRTATKTVQGAGKVLAETGKGAVKIGKRGVKAGVATATLDPRMMKEALKVRMHGKKKRECKHEKELTTSKAAYERDVEELEESGSISLHDSTGKCGAVYFYIFDVSELSVMLRPLNFFVDINFLTYLFASPSRNITTGLLFSSTNVLDRRPGLQRPGLVTTYEYSDGASDKMSEDNLALRDYSIKSSVETESNLSTASPHKKKKSKLKLLGVVPIPGTQKMYSEDRRAERAEKRLAKMIRRPSWEASMTVGKY
jgi:hypothetical protein